MSKNVEHQMKGENLDMGDKLLRSSLHNSKVNIRKVYIKSIKSKCNKMGYGYDNDKKEGKVVKRTALELILQRLRRVRPF